MAELIPPIFRRSSEASINIDYTDMATGTGYVIFYPADVSGSYILTTSPFYAHDGYTRTTTADATVNFDVSFLRPVTLKGDAIAQVPTALCNKTGGGFSDQEKYYMNICKVSGGTETILASGSDAFIYTCVATNPSYVYGNMCLKLTCAKTSFKIGDTLRFKLIVPNRNDANTPHYAGHDPKGRTDIKSSSDTGTIAWPYTARAEVHMPFLIQT